MSREEKIIISIFLIVIGAAMRLLPHAWNVAPIAAIALFAGVYLGRNYALILPPLAMLMGDIFIGFYEWRLAIVVYVSYMLIGLVGSVIKNYKNWGTIIAGGISGSILFFLATNWAVWQFSSWYPHDWSGLMQCYANAMPFFRNTLVGDLFYVSVLFGAFEIVAIRLKIRRDAANEIK